jgi:hypothetical protein
MMSLVQIEVLIRFWYDPFAYQHKWNPVQVEYIAHCVEKGILTNSAVKISANHEALRPYIEAICAIPEPYQKSTWVVEPKP